MVGTTGTYSIAYTLYEPQIDKFENQVSELTFDKANLQSDLVLSQSIVSGLEIQTAKLEKELTDTNKTLVNTQKNVLDLESQKVILDADRRAIEIPLHPEIVDWFGSACAEHGLNLNLRK